MWDAIASSILGVSVLGEGNQGSWCIGTVLGVFFLNRISGWFFPHVQRWVGWPGKKTAIKLRHVDIYIYIYCNTYIHLCFALLKYYSSIVTSNIPSPFVSFWELFAGSIPFFKRERSSNQFLYPDSCSIHVKWPKSDISSASTDPLPSVVKSDVQRKQDWNGNWKTTKHHQPLLFFHRSFLPPEMWKFDMDKISLHLYQELSRNHTRLGVRISSRETSGFGETPKFSELQLEVDIHRQFISSRLSSKQKNISCWWLKLVAPW